MIVYNVGRRWFAEKATADKYRIAEGLRPSATLKVTVEHRDELTALLEALCSPAKALVENANKTKPLAVDPILIDRAYVMPGKDIPEFIPRFLLDDEGKKLWDERHARKVK